MEQLRVSNASVGKKLEKAKQRVQKQTDYLKSYQNLYQALEVNISENLDSKSQDSEGNISDREIHDSDSNDCGNTSLNHRYSNGKQFSHDNFGKDLTCECDDAMKKRYLPAISSPCSPARKHKNIKMEETLSSGSMDGKENEILYKSKAPPPSKKRLLPIENSSKLTPRKFSEPNLVIDRDVKRTHSW